MYKSSNNIYEQNRADFLVTLEDVDLQDFEKDCVLRIVEGTDYFEAPLTCTSDIGTLYEYSKRVYHLLTAWTSKHCIEWYRTSSPFIVGFLHMACKIDKYNYDNIYDTHEINPFYMSYGSIGTDSLFKILQHFKLNEQEAMCIRWFMGAQEPLDQRHLDDLFRVTKRYNQVLWLHHAATLTMTEMNIRYNMNDREENQNYA